MKGRSNRASVELPADDRALARNVCWNALGLCGPLLVAVVALPILLRTLGTDRLGILMLAWIVIGNFSLFDMGFGVALTKLVAERLAGDETDTVGRLAWTGNLLMVAIGIIGMICLGVATPWLVHDLLKIPAALQREAVASCFLLALAVPVVVSSTGLRGVLEAYQRFDLTNSVRIPLGILTFLSPLLVLPFSHSLVALVAALIAARVASWLALLMMCRRISPALARIEVSRREIRAVLTLGSWITVSGILSPVMVYFDRFLIGAVLSMAAVAYYTVPYEVVIKLTLIPAALIGVLLPALSAGIAHDRARSALLFDRGVRYVMLLVLPFVLVLVTFAREGLGLWLGGEFAANSTGILQVLAVGVLLNSLAHVPFVMLQAHGRADVIAKLHLIELPLYLAGIWWLLQTQGVLGAAWAWTARVAIDGLVLFALTHHFIPRTDATVRRLLFPLAASLGLLITCALLEDVRTRALIVAVGGGVLAAAAWKRMLDPEERRLLKRKLSDLRFWRAPGVPPARDKGPR